MIIGIDIHGVLDTHTVAFKTLIDMFRTSNHLIYIITGPEEHKAKEELDRLGLVSTVHYDKVLSVVDWLKEHLKEEQMWTDKNGNWWCDDANWWCSKARICTEFNVDVLFDDSAKYLIGWDVTECKTEFHLVERGSMERKR